MTRRQPEKGVVLVTILSVMALCVTVIVAMTTRSEQATLSTSRDLDQAQAQSLATSAEVLALFALKSDLSTAPEADGPEEPWAHIVPSGADDGTVQVSVWDESARFNLNTLLEGSPTGRNYLRLIVAEAGLPPEVSVRISASLRGGRPLQQISDLASRAGLSEAEVATLAPLVTSTPPLSSTVNINTASATLVRAMLQNPAQAADLLTRRKTGMITPDVLSGMGLILPAGLSLRSNVYGLQITAAFGGAKVQTYARIQRWISPDGTAHAVISARKWISSSFNADLQG